MWLLFTLKATPTFLLCPILLRSSLPTTNMQLASLFTLSLLISSGGQTLSPFLMSLVISACVVLPRTYVFLLMLLHLGALALFLGMNGLLFACPHPGKLRAGIFAGWKRSQLNFWYISWSLVIFMMFDSLSTLKIRAQLVLWIRVEAGITISTPLSAAPTQSSSLYLSCLNQNMLHQLQTLQTPSCAENLGFRASRYFLLSSSLMSFDPALFMSSLDPFIFSATHVIERSVGGRSSSPPCPTFTRRFSPYSYSAPSSSVLNKSTASFSS